MREELPMTQTAAIVAMLLGIGAAVAGAKSEDKTSAAIPAS